MKRTLADRQNGSGSGHGEALRTLAAALFVVALGAVFCYCWFTPAY